MGRPFAAILKISRDEEIKNFKLEFDFGQNQAAKTANRPTSPGRPRSAHVRNAVARIRNGLSYVCEKSVANPKTCDFRSGRIILQQEIAREQMAKLLNEGSTDLLPDFKSSRTGRLQGVPRQAAGRQGRLRVREEGAEAGREDGGAKRGAAAAPVEERRRRRRRRCRGDGRQEDARRQDRGQESTGQEGGREKNRRTQGRLTADSARATKNRPAKRSAGRFLSASGASRSTLGEMRRASESSTRDGFAELRPEFAVDRTRRRRRAARLRRTMRVRRMRDERLGRVIVQRGAIRLDRGHP